MNVIPKTPPRLSTNTTCMILNKKGRIDVQCTVIEEEHTIT